MADDRKTDDARNGDEDRRLEDPRTGQDAGEPSRSAEAATIEEYLDRACGHLGVGWSLREHIRDELRGDLIEAVEGHVARGLPRREAVARAVEDFGDPAEVAAGLDGVYGKHVLRLLVEKAMEWRVRTMKSGWKWTFAAHAMLAILIVAEVLFITCAVVYIFPMIEAEYASLGLVLPAYWKTTLSITRVLSEWSLPLLAVAAAALAAFEWRYRGEQKSAVRLAVGGGLAAALMALVWAVAFAMTVPHVQLHFQGNDERAAAMVRRHAADAEAAYQDLERAVATGEEAKVRDAARGLLRAMGQIDRTRAGILALTALGHDPGEIGALRDRLRQVEECAGVLTGVGSHPLTAEDKDKIARLEGAYTRLAAAVEGWPRD